MPIGAADVGIKASSPRFAYAAQGIDGSPGTRTSSVRTQTDRAADAASSTRQHAVTPVHSLWWAALPRLGAADDQSDRVSPPRQRSGVMVVGIENFSEGERTCCGRARGGRRLTSSRSQGPAKGRRLAGLSRLVAARSRVFTLTVEFSRLRWRNAEGRILTDRARCPKGPV